MITVNLHITVGPVSRDVRIRAKSLAGAMRIAGRGKPGVKVELRGPLAPATIIASKTRAASIHKAVA